MRSNPAEGFEVSPKDRGSSTDDSLWPLAAPARTSAVPNGAVVFDGTILDNLRIGRSDAPMSDVVAACKLAEIHDTIEGLPRGDETPVGEHGVGLSGGQRQRPSIARALLRQPRVLIFDEATPALDVRSAQAFARTVSQLRGRTTILFIAHHVPGNLQADVTVSTQGLLAAHEASLQPKGPT